MSGGRQDPGLAPASQLPPWHSVLAVVAHPDDESFGLGAVLAAFAEAGARVSVLCLTRGEASTLHGVEGDLTALRAAELDAAAAALGVSDVVLLDHPDGRLADAGPDVLLREVVAAARQVRADGVIAFDPSGVTGHPDHVVATAAATRGAHALDLPMLGWTVPTPVARQLRAERGVAFAGHEAADIDLVVATNRTRQLRAVACHPSQAVPGSAVWRRLELLGDQEHLRWLRRPSPDEHPVGSAAPANTGRRG